MVCAEAAINDLLLSTDSLTHPNCNFGEPLANANRPYQVCIEAIIAALTVAYRYLPQRM